MGKHTRIFKALEVNPSGLTIEELSHQTNLPSQLVFCVVEGTNHGHEFEKFNDNGNTKYQIRQDEREP